jgi:hypothetical protein
MGPDTLSLEKITVNRILSIVKGIKSLGNICIYQTSICLILGTLLLEYVGVDCCLH